MSKETELNRLFEEFVESHSLAFESESTSNSAISEFDSTRREFYGILKEICEEGKSVEILPKSDNIEEDIVISDPIWFYNGTILYGWDSKDSSVGFNLKEAQGLKVVNS